MKRKLQSVVAILAIALIACTAAIPQQAQAAGCGNGCGTIRVEDDYWGGGDYMGRLTHYYYGPLPGLTGISLTFGSAHDAVEWMWDSYMGGGSTIALSPSSGGMCGTQQHPIPCILAN